jgi:hypothetical protein
MCAALLALPGLAWAASEREANHPVANAQTLEIGSITVDGVATTGAIVDGVIGNLAGPAVLDTDYYVFEGQAGDVVTVDIDGGMGGLRSVDTILAIFGPGPGYQVLRQKDDIARDAGSISPFDARIDNFVLPASGMYVVGVSSTPRLFAPAGGGTTSDSLNSARANGDYTLIVSGVSIAVLQISIELKPGSNEVAPINPKSKGKVPVALLGAANFAVDDVDTSSVTFGHSGNEASLSKCGTPTDVNGDLFPDLVCHFENQRAVWEPTDDEGILRGKLANGKKFEGRGWLKVVPVKAEE